MRDEYGGSDNECGTGCDEDSCRSEVLYFCDMRVRIALYHIAEFFKGGVESFCRKYESDEKEDDEKFKVRYTDEARGNNRSYSASYLYPEIQLFLPRDGKTRKSVAQAVDLFVEHGLIISHRKYSAIISPMYAKVGSVLVVFSLMCALTFGGFVHAVVPHDHGEEHGGAPSALWSDLHATLGSTQRKMFFAAVSPILLLLLFSITQYGEKVLLLSRRRERELVRMFDPIHGELLRRGVMPHRAFR